MLNDGIADLTADVDHDLRGRFRAITQHTEKVIDAKVIVVQRDSVNSGWKVDAINSGKSVIGGIEPELDDITHDAVEAGTLSASSDFSVLSDADVILVSIQTDKNEEWF